MKNPKFINGEIYHIYNRGVEKRAIFLDNEDRLRFIHDLFEFNDVEPVDRFYIPVGLKQTKIQFSEVTPRKIERPTRKLLIEILAFCLRNDHYHFMVRQLKEGGITTFMRKLGTGYTMYFNPKYRRVGALFQGSFKAVAIKTDAHFIHLPFYIHLNSLDSIAPEWRKREIKNISKIIQYLNSYRWSSHLDYIGKKNFPSVTQREFLTKFWGSSEEYQKAIIQWLQEIDIEDLKTITIEE